MPFRRPFPFIPQESGVYIWIAKQLGGARLSVTEEDEQKLAETVAHEHLARRYKRLGYYPTQHGEVDFLFPREWAIEVKWAPAATNLSKTYKDLRIARKWVWTQNNFLAELPESAD